MQITTSFRVAAILALALGTAQAQDQSNLVGTWTGETTILLDTGEKVIEAPRTQSIVITGVKDNLIRGYRTWTALQNNQKGFVGSVPEDSAREPFIGIIQSNGKTIRMVETDDRGMMFCELIAPDQIEMTYMEAAPHAVIYTTVYQKVE